MRDMATCHPREFDRPLSERHVGPIQMTDESKRPLFRLFSLIGHRIEVSCTSPLPMGEENVTLKIK